MAGRIDRKGKAARHLCRTNDGPSLIPQRLVDEDGDQVKVFVRERLAALLQLVSDGDRRSLDRAIVEVGFSGR